MRIAKKGLLLIISLIGMYSCTGNTSSSTGYPSSFTSSDTSDSSSDDSSSSASQDVNFSSNDITYTITWKNYDGTILEVDQCQAYVTPTYTGTTPQKTSVDDYVFVFSGWSPSLVPAVEDITYTATFTSLGVDDLYDLEFDSEYDGYVLSGKSTKNGLNFTSLTLPAEYDDGINGEKPVVGLGEDAFDNFYKIKKFTLPESLLFIGGSAFADCTSLTDITIPDSVESIGASAFWYCNSLKSITLPASLKNIDTSAFYYCSALKSIVIPDETLTIGSYAFAFCISLTSVTIGDSVTTIGNYAFAYDSWLSYIIIPLSVTTMGQNVFAYCNNLLMIYIEATSIPKGWDSSWKNLCGADYKLGYEG